MFFHVREAETASRKALEDQNRKSPYTFKMRLKNAPKT